MPPKVLVVDDDAVMRSLLRKLLELRPGYAVTDAVDGETGKRLTQADQYSCIVLDHILPDMTGLDFLRWFRARDPKTPVVVFTGFGDETLAVDMMKAGANDYVSKVGFSAERFLAAVRDAVQATNQEVRA
ncbi:MAG TPA: response regulator [Candidatus Thermoplasmatota archaeon]